MGQDEVWGHYGNCCGGGENGSEDLHRFRLNFRMRANAAVAKLLVND